MSRICNIISPDFMTILYRRIYNFYEYAANTVRQVAMEGLKARQCVLVVDDHPQVLRFVEIGLRVRGFDVITTTSGRQALEMMEEVKPDVMLLDIVMPEISGFEVLEELRAFSKVPVIVLSGSIENREEALRLGASAFVPKPFEPDEIVREISSLLSR
jgi:two-component system KDP operon response regulator KdpE